MKFTFLLIIIPLVALNNNTIEILTDKGYSASQIMFYRGLFSASLLLMFSAFAKRNLFPKNWQPQLIRIGIDGLSIFLLYTSYKFLSAGTVALIQRMDIPLLIIISVFSKETKSSLQFYLSIWSVLILAFFFLDAKFIDEEPLGFIYAASSVGLLATTYFLIKKQTSKESQLTLGLLYCLGMLLWGCIFIVLYGLSFKVRFTDLWIFAIGGLFQFLVVYMALQLFKLYSAEKARLPFILGALATLVLEMVIERKIFSVNQIGLSVLLTGIIATICVDPKVPKFTKGSNGQNDERLPLT